MPRRPPPLAADGRRLRSYGRFGAFAAQTGLRRAGRGYHARVESLFAPPRLGVPAPPDSPANVPDAPDAPPGPEEPLLPGGPDPDESPEPEEDDGAS